MAHANLADWTLATLALVMTVLIATVVPAQANVGFDTSIELPPPETNQGPWRIDADLLNGFSAAADEPQQTESEQAEELLARTGENYRRALDQSDPNALVDERISIIEDDLNQLTGRRDQMAERLQETERSLVFRMRANESEFNSEDPRLWLQNRREMGAAHLRMEAMRERIDELDATIDERQIQLEDLRRQREEQRVTDLLQAPDPFTVPNLAHDPQRPYRELYQSTLDEAEMITRRVLMQQVDHITMAPAQTVSPVDLVVN